MLRYKELVSYTYLFQAVTQREYFLQQIKNLHIGGSTYNARYT